MGDKGLVKGLHGSTEKQTEEAVSYVDKGSEAQDVLPSTGIRETGSERNKRQSRLSIP